MRGYRLVPTLTVTMQITPLLVPSAIAAPAPAPYPTTATERADLAVIASGRGMTMEDAARRYAWQDPFAIAATSIEAAYPEAFSSSEITSEDPAIATIRFAGDVPPGVEKLLTGIPDAVEVRLVGGERLSAREIGQAVADAHRAVVATGQVENAVTTYDRVQDLVRVEASPRLGTVPLGATPEDLADRARALVAELPSSVGRIDVTLDPAVTAGHGDARIGGGRLEISGQSALSCTAGFNVVNSAGTSGVATAGHCADNLTHENTNGATEYTLTLQSQHEGTWGDFQWHTSTDSEPDDFYYNSSSTRDVAAVANPSDNQTICRFGHATGAQCSMVVDTELCATLDGVNKCHLVRMDVDEAEGGDSGGPWYYNTTAYGFHTGYVGCGFLWQNSCDVWSRATYIDDALGVTVKTS